MTKAAYVARANGLCRVMNARVAALGKTVNARMIASTAAIDAATLRQLRALPAPQGKSSALAAIYEKVDNVVKDLTQWLTALRTGNQAAAQRAANKVQADGDAANSASNAYGLTVCGS
jgi:hypothetical protein